MDVSRDRKKEWFEVIARSELSRLENQIDKLVMAIANGADAIPLNTKIKELESRQHNLQVKIIDAADAEPLIHPNLAEIYRAKIENLAALLDDPKCQAEAFDIIRYLVDEVRLIPDTGQLRIELKGELAGILSLCGTKKTPTTSYEERAEQVKMVAGARNQLFRTPFSTFVHVTR